MIKQTCNLQQMTSSIFSTIRTSTFLLLSSLFALSGQAQNSNHVGALETEAKVWFDKLVFHKALNIYLQLDSLVPDLKYKYYIGVCYVNELNNEKALPYLEKCLEIPERFPRNLDYYAAKAYHLSHKFDEAIVHYEIYRQKIKPAKKNKAVLKEVDREIESCRYGKMQMAKPGNYKVINLGSTINSPYGDYGPVLSADQQMLIFTSARPGTTGGKRDESDGRYYEDIYVSYRSDSGWTQPVGLGSGVNTSGHDASISLSPDGQKLLIYRFNDQLLGSASHGDLYMSRLKGTTWTQATKLPENINTKNWEPSACFSPDERVLFFSSNREGGYGGTDIYMVRQLPNGEWALPMNLGSTINTSGDEDSPFIHPDGKTLYFSSNGHRTIGGFDIFVSRLQDSSRTWSYPQNLGYPINTAHDDIHFSWSADGRRVYFSSIRPGSQGENDIYYADVNNEAADVMVIKGIVKDSLTGMPVEASIKVFDTATNELTGIYTSNSSSGKYVIIFTEGKKYNITVEAENYRLYYDNVSTSGMKGFQEISKNILLLPEK